VTGPRPAGAFYAGVAMQATLAYSSARILLLVVSVILLYLIGLRGLLLLAVACVASGLASFVLLSRQRDKMPAPRWPGSGTGSSGRPASGLGSKKAPEPRTTTSRG
jgi:Protein of unknown function (DUF4229)